MPDFTPTTWAAALLKTLGIHQTPGAVQALAGWAKAEGGHWNNDAKYNPLNTTQPEPGAGNTGTQGNIKVYRDWNQGLQATATTLKNGRYGGILAALQAGDPAAVANAIGKTPWGTSGDLVRRTILGTPRVAGVHAPGMPTAPRSPGARTQSTTTQTTPGVDNSAARAAAIQQFLGTKGADSLDFAMQIRALRDVAGRKVTTTTPGSTPSAPDQPAASGGGSFAKGHSQLLELIHNTGSGPGYAVKNGQKVNGPSVYGAVWAGHKDHVHVAAGPKTIVEIGRLAQKMGLHVGENPHFGGVSPVHVAGSYHYRGEAVDVSGDSALMNKFAAAVERLYGIH